MALSRITGIMYIGGVLIEKILTSFREVNEVKLYMRLETNPNRIGTV